MIDRKKTSTNLLTKMTLFHSHHSGNNIPPFPESTKHTQVVNISRMILCEVQVRNVQKVGRRRRTQYEHHHVTQFITSYSGICIKDKWFIAKDAFLNLPFQPSYTLMKHLYAHTISSFDMYTTVYKLLSHPFSLASCVLLHTLTFLFMAKPLCISMRVSLKNLSMLV